MTTNLPPLSIETTCGTPIKPPVITISRELPQAPEVLRAMVDAALAAHLREIDYDPDGFDVINGASSAWWASKPPD